MFKFIAAATLLAAAASPAIAGDTVSSRFSFQADGGTFSGVRTEKAGVVTLRGQEYGGKPFNLRVKDNRVTGTFGTKPVNFSVPAARYDAVASLR